MKNIRQHISIGILFIAAGLLLGSGPLLQYWRTKHADGAFGRPLVSSSQPIKTNLPLIQGKPTHLIIPSLNINVVVTDGYYYPKTQTWTLNSDKAQYAVMTPYANNREGNTFIYGHALSNIFGSLPNIKPGSEVLVFTDNKHKFLYKLTGSRVTNPSDTALFDYQGPPILTLQTCTGLWYQNRYLFVFSLEKVA